MRRLLPLLPLMLLFLGGLLILGTVCCSHSSSTGGGPISTPTPTIHIDDPLPYLAQNICPDGSLAAPDCIGAAPTPATLDTPLTQRRSDWGPGDAPYAFFDSVRDPSAVALTLWAFVGDTTQIPSRGDGGEVYALGAGAILISSTQDGGTLSCADGSRTNSGTGCAGGAAPQNLTQYFVGGTGWVVSPPDIALCSNGWTQLIAALNISLGSPTPPSSLNQAPTRVCLYQNMPFPMILGGQHVTRSADTIISEHYSGGGGDIGSSTALERSYFAKGYGRIAWAAWTVGGQPVDASRYPSGALPLNDPTMPGAVMADVRLTTNVVNVAAWTPRSFGWP